MCIRDRYYLVDTTPSNGCLRVIKGSHLNRHPLHDILPNAHGEALQRVDDADHPAYQHFSGEVDISVKAGDLVIGDSRLLHASHGNRSDERRTVSIGQYIMQGMSIQMRTFNNSETPVGRCCVNQIIHEEQLLRQRCVAARIVPTPPILMPK